MIGQAKTLSTTGYTPTATPNTSQLKRATSNPKDLSKILQSQLDSIEHVVMDDPSNVYQWCDIRAMIDLLVEQAEKKPCHVAAGVSSSYEDRWKKLERLLPATAEWVIKQVTPTPVADHVESMLNNKVVPPPGVYQIERPIVVPAVNHAIRSAIAAGNRSADSLEDFARNNEIDFVPAYGQQTTFRTTVTPAIAPDGSVWEVICGRWYPLSGPTLDRKKGPKKRKPRTEFDPFSAVFGTILGACLFIKPVSLTFDNNHVAVGVLILLAIVFGLVFERVVRLPPL